VLMFHGVDDSGSVLTVSAAELDSLVRSIRASGHEIVPLAALLAGTSPDAVALTFDDGFVSVAEQAAPVLARLDAPATLFLTTGYVGKDNRWPTQPADAPRFAMMGWPEVQRLSRGGWAIEAHSRSHPDLRVLEDEELDRELVGPCDDIEQRTGRRPRGVAYPYGYFDERVAERARGHFAFAVTTVFRALGSPDDTLRIPRLDAYYLRAPRVHRHFGSRRFAAYLVARGALRRLRKHPGEINR
jgi:peptidoglycan/xylan/chitin deacetylase (PgdA/CDA1 family)